jgi:hypothetical protein
VCLCVCCCCGQAHMHRIQPGVEPLRNPVLRLYDQMFLNATTPPPPPPLPPPPLPPPLPLDNFPAGFFQVRVGCSFAL